MIDKYVTYLILIVICATHFSVDAQIIDSNISSLRKKKIPININYYKLDTLPILPNSFIVAESESYQFELDEASSVISIKNHTSKKDSVWVVYRVMNILHPFIFSHRSYDSVRYFFSDQSMEENNLSKTGIQFRMGKLKTEGSIGRSMSAGNNRDVALQSSLNLRMGGYIGDSIELSAVISDDNLPIQPDGNTQYLRDFDRIYLQLRKNGNQLTLGDIDLSERSFSYLSFNKRIQGIRYDRLNNKEQGKSIATYSASIAKGKFFRQMLTPLDGNQGPYRLQGANNELYFVILAGSEKVFYDGELLQRGQDQDYTIDYNTAEIVFTPKRPINKDRRIQVEFEYAERNYVNSLFYFKNDFSLSKKITLSAGYYRLGDAKNSSIDQSLTYKERAKLAMLGDSVSQAYMESAVLDTFSIGKILYQKKDTFVNGIHDSVFVYSNTDADKLYKVEFVFLGQGKGDYVPIGSSSNEKIFKWVAPGIGQNKMGQWAPVRLLKTPKKLEIATFKTSWKPGKGWLLDQEFAYSKNDVNLFSSRDKENDDGFSGKLFFQKKWDQFLFFRKEHEIQLDASIEHINSNFTTTERIRTVEFYRDWSLGLLVSQEQENLAKFSSSIRGKEGGIINYDVARFKRGEDYIGIKQNLLQELKFLSFNIKYQLQYTQLDKQSLRGYFFRPSWEISKKFGKENKWIAGAGYFSDRNHIQSKQTDSLVAESFLFYEYKYYLQSSWGENSKWGINYFSRQNYIPSGKVFQALDISRNYVLQVDWLDHPNIQLRMNTAYRILFDQRKYTKEKSLANRTETNWNIFNHLMEGQLVYETSGGQEQQREYSYVAVPAGQGMYYWIDYNNNGIEELNEFEVGIFQDQKKYIRVNTPVSRYVKCLNNNINFAFQINPNSTTVTVSKNLISFLRRFSTASFFQLNTKSFSNNKLLINPLAFHLVDTSLISMQTFISNTLYFNKNNRIWMADITRDYSRQKSLMLYGFEQNTSNRYRGSIRINWNASFSTTMNLNQSDMQLFTENASFLNRNYSLKIRSVEPNITYLFNRNFRAGLSWRFQYGENEKLGGEQCSANVGTVDIRYQVKKGGSFQLRFSKHQLDYLSSNPMITPAGFILLEGLQPGQNKTWSILMTQRFAGNLEVNIQYEGRSAGTARPIHTGTASIRALF